MKKFGRFLAIAVAVGAVAVSCTTEDYGDGRVYTPAPSVGVDDDAFVVVTKVGDAYYYMTSETLSEGAISVVGNGVEGNSITEYVIVDNEALYTVADGGGNNPAPVTKYIFDAATDRLAQSDYYSTVKYEAWGQWDSQFLHLAPIEDTTGTAQGSDSDTVTRELGTVDSGWALAGEYSPYYVNYSFSGAKASKYVKAENFLGTGETVTFSGFAEAGGKLYVAVVPMYATPWAVEKHRDELEATLKEVAGNDANLDDYIARGYGYDVFANYMTGLTSWSQSFTPASGIPFPLTVDKCYIAVYDNSAVGSFENPTKIIETDKMGAALCRRVRNPRSSMTTYNGDVYVFSPGGLRKTDDEFRQYFTYNSSNGTYSNQIEDLKLMKGEHGASVMRINGGDTDFDSTFGTNGVIDLESKFSDILGDHVFTRVFSIGNGKFLLRIMDEPYTITNGCYNTMHKVLYDTRFAVLDLTTPSSPKMDWVSGIPVEKVNSSSASAGITDPYCEGGVAYIPMGYAAGGAQIFVVDTNDTDVYVATEGLYVNTDYIMGIGKMIAQ